MAKKYIAISLVQQYIKELRAAYPEAIFPDPVPGEEFSPSSCHAAAVRMTCDNIMGRLPAAGIEEPVYVAEEEEIEKGRKQK